MMRTSGNRDRIHDVDLTTPKAKDLLRVCAALTIVDGGGKADGTRVCDER